MPTDAMLLLKLITFCRLIATLFQLSYRLKVARNYKRNP